MDLAILVIFMAIAMFSGFILGRLYEQGMHKYAGRLLITRDDEDHEIYISCEFTELNNIEELYGYNTVTLKIQTL